MPSPTYSHQQIEEAARLIVGLQRERTAACVSAIESVGAEILSHLETWGDRLRGQLKEQLAALEVGCPPSFIRVAGQSHLERPFNRLLGWMVDPAGDHGWGDGFLKLLAHEIGLPEMAEDLDAGDTPLIRVEQTLDGDDSGKEPDLAVRTLNAALLVENKVWAPESGDQYGPYLEGFRKWAQEDRAEAVAARKTRTFLAARDRRLVPKRWDGFFAHSDLAGLLYRIGEGETGAPAWARICAVVCGISFEDRQDHAKLREARELLRETADRPVTMDQVTQLRSLVPLPRPLTPWSESFDTIQKPTT